eukprot:3949489-Prorocentrum_lima.AAC.1
MARTVLFLDQAAHPGIIASTGMRGSSPGSAHPEHADARSQQRRMIATRTHTAAMQCYRLICSV